MTAFDGQKKQLSKLIKNWNLVDVSSSKEFDKFSEKILNKLYEGVNALIIKRIIESELSITFGLFNWDFNSELLANQIMIWWHSFLNRSVPYQ